MILWKKEVLFFIYATIIISAWEYWIEFPPRNKRGNQWSKWESKYPTKIWLKSDTCIKEKRENLSGTVGLKNLHVGSMVDIWLVGYGDGHIHTELI